MPKPTPLTFVLIDDHDLVRRSMAGMFADDPGVKFVGEASDAQGGINLIEDKDPDVALIDMMLEKGSGLDIVRRLEESGSKTRVLMITGMTSPVLIQHALSLPAVHGFVSKYDSAGEVIDAMHALSQGQDYLGASLKELLDINPSAETKLTVREYQVMTLVADGLEDKEIAQRLEISLPTVRTHRRQLRSKLGVRNTAELTRYALTGQRLDGRA